MTDKDKALVPVKNQSVNVSLIKNMKDLKSEINFLKTRVRLNELEIKTRTQELPKRTVQYATTKFFPAYLAGKFFKNTGSIYKTSKSLFGKKKEETPKRGLLSFVKKLF